MGRGIWIFFALLIVVIGILLVWGYATNWWRSFDSESVSRYCYTACVNVDKKKFCTPNLIVHDTASNSPNYGSTMKDISCANLAVNHYAQLCPDITCP